MTLFSGLHNLEACVHCCCLNDFDLLADGVLVGGNLNFPVDFGGWLYLIALSGLDAELGSAKRPCLAWGVTTPELMVRRGYPKASPSGCRTTLKGSLFTLHLSSPAMQGHQFFERPVQCPEIVGRQTVVRQGRPLPITRYIKEMGCNASKDEATRANVSGAVANREVGTGGGAGTAPATNGAQGGLGGSPEAKKVADTSDGKSTAFISDPTNTFTAMRPNESKTENTPKKEGHRVKNIFAKPLRVLDSYSPPVFPKSDEEREFIVKALQSNFVFETLTQSDMMPMVDAFEQVSVESDVVVIKQGDEGDYFYIIVEGRVQFLVDDNVVGKADTGSVFGELALLYTCPRAATVRSTRKTTLFRVDQTCFRFILKKLTEKGQVEKQELLQGVSFLKDLDLEDRSKLTRVMTPIRFNADEVIVKKGEVGDVFYILKEGRVKVTDIGSGSSKYEDVTLKAGEYFGERALVTGEPRMANIIAITKGLAFRINRETFETVLGKLSDLILRAQDRRQLAAIKIIMNSKLDQQSLSSLSKLIKDRQYKKGDSIFTAGAEIPAALYFVREGSIQIKHKASSTQIKDAGSYFGDDQLLADSQNGVKRSATAVTTYSATVLEDCTVGILLLSDCRKVLDTRFMGRPLPSIKDSLLDRGVKMSELKRHKILGAGTFGQVWLVSRTASNDQRLAYALKIQSKYELCQDGQAKAVVQEKNVMAKLSHPFLIRLVNSFQDKDFVYMVMSLVQGGELYHVIHTDKCDGISEADSRFYGACIAEGLGYVHRRGYAYRDLKPENVLINENGYPVIIDFGFAKYVEDKTFTLCGTPLYLAPEVVC